MKILGRVTVAAAILCLVLAGCDDGGGGGGGDAARGACYDSCEHQAKGTNCSDEVAASWDKDCKELCDALVAGFVHEGACLDEFEVLSTCQLDLAWECMVGGNIPVASDTSPCETEQEAHTACVNGLGG